MESLNATVTLSGNCEYSNLPKDGNITTLSYVLKLSIKAPLVISINIGHHYSAPFTLVSFDGDKQCFDIVPIRRIANYV